MQLNKTHMEILIRSPHEVLPAQAEIDIYERFEKLEHLMPGILYCDVLLSKVHREPHAYGVHVKLSVRGEDLYASEEGDTYLHAARLVVRDLENQIRKKKEMKDFHPENKGPAVEEPEGED